MVTFPLKKDMDLVIIGSLLGYSKITTRLIYSRTNRERQKKALDFRRRKS